MLCRSLIKKTGMAGSRQSNWRVAHGVVFVRVAACLQLVPILRAWPWVWLGALTVYFLIVIGTSPLRHSLAWVRIGRFSAKTIVGTGFGMALTSLVLLAFHA